VLVGVSVVVFLALHLTPGDPAPILLGPARPRRSSTGASGGSATAARSLVVAAVEVRGGGTVRLRLGAVPAVSGTSLVGFIDTLVEKILAA
jgi:hypothetical protein